MGIKCHPHIACPAHVGPPVVAHDHLGGKALGGDQIGEAVEQMRGVLGHRHRTARRQKVKLLPGQGADVLVDHVVFLYLPLQSQPGIVTVVGPDAPLLPMVHTCQILQHRGIVGIVKIDTADMIHSVGSGMLVRLHGGVQPVLQDGQVSLRADVLILVPKGFQFFHSLTSALEVPGLTVQILASDQELGIVTVFHSVCLLCVKPVW